MNGNAKHEEAPVHAHRRVLRKVMAGIGFASAYVIEAYLLYALSVSFAARLMNAGRLFAF